MALRSRFLMGLTTLAAFAALSAAGCGKSGSDTPAAMATPSVAPEVQSQINAAQQADAARRAAHSGPPSAK